MKRSHAFLIALAIGVAAVFGLMAATRTAHLGSTATQATTISSAQIAARNRALDRMEIALRKQSTQKPPALPALPAAAPQQPQQRVALRPPRPDRPHRAPTRRRARGRWRRARRRRVR